MPTTKLTGTFIRSGSIPVTALGGGVISSSVQLATTLPGGTVSSSGQVDYNSIQNKLSGIVSSSAQVQPLLPNGTVSSSAQYPGWVTASSQVDYNSIANKLSGVYSSSTQIANNLPVGTVSSSGQVDYNNITNKLGGVVSSSAQVQPLLPDGTISSSTQVNAILDADGVLSSSNQVVVQNTTGIGAIATTGSNTFRANQTITGSLFVSQNLIVQGSSSVSYISQSTLDIGTNLITVNTQNPAVRFGGLAVIDSGSSPQRSGSIFFDSINDQWMFIHQNTVGGITSSVVLMGPQTFNNVGNETLLTQNRVLKGGGLEHVTDSQITDNGITVSITNGLSAGTTITASAFTATTTSSLAAVYSSSAQTVAAIAGQTVAPAIINATGTVSGATLAASNGFLTNNNAAYSARNASGLSQRGLILTTTNAWQVGDVDATGYGLLLRGTSITAQEGGIIFGTDNTYDIGLNGSQRPRTGYFGTNVIAGGAISGASIQTSGNGTIGGNLTVATNALFVTSSGNVGIGTTSPSNLLHLKAATNPVIRLEGASDSGYVDYNGTRLQLSAGGGDIYLVAGNSEKVRVTSAGNVGIGTTSPGTLLDVSGTTPTARVIGTGGTTPKLTLSSAGVSAWSFRTSGSDSSFRLDQDGTDRITVLSGGNVGINTTSPTQILTLSGNTGQPGSSGTTQNGVLRIQVPTGVNGYGETLDFGMHVGISGPNSYGWIQATNRGTLGVNYNLNLNPNGGNVGIGTTTPSASLHVSGTMMIQGVIERTNITGSAPPTTLNLDAISGSVFYLSGSSANNWTVNFRGSAGTSLNSMMFNGQSMTFAVLVNHGVTGFTASAHQVDGTSITPRWQGGTLPSGSGTSTDIYSYTLIKTGNAAFNIFASQTRFA